MSDHLTDADLDAMQAKEEALTAIGTAELPDAAFEVLVNHDLLLAEVRRLRAQVERVRALARDDYTHHDGHTPILGDDECPACWANDIRYALDGVDHE